MMPGGAANPANSFSNRSGNHQFGRHRSGNHQFGGHRSGNHQFGNNNPNFKRNLALMKMYQQQMPPSSQQMPPSPQQMPPLPQQIKNQFLQAITNAYQKGCFGQYSVQIYNILISIINKISPNILYALPNTLTSLQQSLGAYISKPTGAYISTPVGALWANVPPNIQSEIITKLQNGCANGCIPQRICTKLINLLYGISGYSGPPQTYSSILNADYNTCMANSPNSSACNYFLEANNAISDGYNYLKTYGEALNM
jgi:hypothetical protein